MRSVQGRQLVIGGVPLAVDLFCFACAFIPVGGSSPGGFGGAGFDPTEDVKESDATAFGEGYITVVPIEPDYTADHSKRFKSMIRGFHF